MRRHRQVLGLFVVAFISVLGVSALGAGAQGTTERCDGKVPTIVGTPGNDTITGTTGADVIVGLAGDDRIFGLGGADVICGGTGNDVLGGGAGKDYIDGGKGNDRIIGGSGNDMLLGRAGNDRISGKGGNDTLIGGVAVDRLAGNAGNDTCITDVYDRRAATCSGNFTRLSGIGDAVVEPVLGARFSVLEYCFPFIDRCDDYYVARVQLDGVQSFDSMGVRAFDANGQHIASYGGAGDRYEGAFIFAAEPATIEIDSGGGPWSITFTDATGVRTAANTIVGEGNTVVFVPPAAPNTTVTTRWTGFGHFAVVGVSASDGRDLVVNEVRFEGGAQAPPFTAQDVVKPGLSLVQVLSEGGDWSVDLAR